MLGIKKYDCWTPGPYTGGRPGPEDTEMIKFIILVNKQVQLYNLICPSHDIHRVLLDSVRVKLDLLVIMRTGVILLLKKGHLKKLI